VVKIFCVTILGVMNRNSFINYDVELNKKKVFNILIVDDDENVASSLKEYLECRGHLVTIVDEGSRGICQLYMNQFDIIFLDYHLDNDINPIYKETKHVPRDGTYLDGIKVTECIRDINSTKNYTKKSIIFAYTGDSSNEAIYNFKESGMDGVIFKPIDVKALDKIMLSLESKNDLDRIFLSKLSKQYNRSLLVFFK
jgi:CheY-like chemotaxis protein